jgi:ribosomal protein S18 acetylase RimI-like enzyme
MSIRTDPKRVEIRRIEERDWKLARALRLRALAEDANAFASTLAEEDAFGDAIWIARAKSNAEGVATSGMFAIVDGAAAGMAIGVRKPNAVELNALWVAPEARGQHAGRALIEAVCEWARSLGVPWVELEVALTSHAAQALYRECGFELTARPETMCGARRVPALRMRRNA